MSEKQSIVALSTCDAKYVAASSSVCEAIWLKNLLKEFDHPQEESIIIYVDNKFAIELCKNLVKHGRRNILTWSIISWEITWNWKLWSSSIAIQKSKQQIFLPKPYQLIDSKDWGQCLVWRCFWFKGSVGSGKLKSASWYFITVYVFCFSITILSIVIP